DDVALLNGGPAHLHRLADRARDVLGRALDPDPARPDREAELGQGLDVTGRRVDEDSGGAVGLGLRGQQVANDPHGTGFGHGEDQHLAGLDLGHGGVDHQVVVLAALDGPGGPGDPCAGQDLDEVEVDVAATAAGLVDGGRAECCQLCDRVVGHRLLTTWGVTRWKASAWWMSWFPEERRAWLPR